MSELEKNIRDTVMSALKTHDIKMRPKWHFILRGTLWAVGGILVLLVLLYLIGFILFSIRETGIWFEPSFGSPGWMAFFRSLPWLLITIAILFILVLEVLVQHFSFAYRTPLLYSALGIISLVLLGGALAAPAHRTLFRATRPQGIPIMEPFYRHYGQERLQDVRRGQVLVRGASGFVMSDPRGETSTVEITPQTKLPAGADFGVGDTVVVFGQSQGGVVRAAGILEIHD